MNKICNKCKEEKDIKLFYKDKRMKDGHLNHCKQCKQLSNKAWSNKNQDKMKAYRDKWIEDNPEANKESKTKYKNNNKEKVAASNSKYNKEYRDEGNRRLANYRAKKLRATPILTDFEEFIIQEIYSLSRLRSELLNVPHEVDHKVPLVSDKVCGLHHPVNLQIITAKQNQSKSNRYWPEMW